MSKLIFSWDERCPRCGSTRLIHKHTRSLLDNEAHLVKCCTCRSYIHMKDYYTSNKQNE